MRRRSSLLLAAALAFLVLSPAALASNLLSDANVKQPTLQVNTAGYALVSYLRQDGTARHVLAWGAVNSNPPSQTVKQVRFKLDYSGGFGAFHNGNYWRTFRNACGRYDGPKLASGSGQSFPLASGSNHCRLPRRPKPP